MNLNSLLDDSTVFDANKIELLQDAVKKMYQGVNTGEIQSVLTQLKLHPESWRLVQPIFVNSTDEDTRFFALSLLNHAIKTRWYLLPINEKIQIPIFLYELSIAAAVSDRCSEGLLTKMIETLINILKKDWPESWPNFIVDICKINQSDNPKLIQNNLLILKLFLEDIFDFATIDIETERRQFLKIKLHEQIFLIRNFVIDCIEKFKAENKTVNMCLIILALLMRNSELNELPDHNTIKILVLKTWQNVNTRISTVDVLTEIFNVYDTNFMKKLEANNVDVTVTDISNLLYAFKESYVMMDSLIKELPEASWNYTQNVPLKNILHWEKFYLQLSICVSTLCKNSLHLIFEAPYPEIAIILKNLNVNEIAIKHLCLSMFNHCSRLTEIKNQENFKTMIEFWGYYLSNYLSKYFLKNSVQLSGAKNVSVTVNSEEAKAATALYKQYYESLNNLREILINNMVKPSEIYLSFDEKNSTCKRDYNVEDTEEVNLYNLIKANLIELTKIGPQDMLGVFNKLLSDISNEIKNDRSNKNFNIVVLNRLCWSVGSVVGIIDQQSELKFFVTLLKQLLVYCQAIKGKDSKSIIASMIMYIIGQFPKYVRANESLLNVVIEKDVEFMFDDFPGIQDMAVEAFYKLANGCGKEIYELKNKNYIREMITSIDRFMSTFATKKLKFLFYNSISIVLYKGCLVEKKNFIVQNEIISLLLNPLNNSLQMILPEFELNINNDALMNNLQTFHMIIKNLVELIQIIERIATGLKEFYIIHQFYQILNSIVHLYLCAEKFIINNIKNKNYVFDEVVTLRKNIIVYFSTCVSSIKATTNAEVENLEVMNQNALDSIVENVLMKFGESTDKSVRDYQLINLSTQIIKMYSNSVNDKVHGVIQFVFFPVLDMIKENYENHQEYRLPFFTFIDTMIQYNFNYVIDPKYCQQFLLSIIFGVQHENPEIGLIGLQSLLLLIDNLEKNPNLLLLFIEGFYYNLINHIMIVFTDTTHTYGINEHIKILFKLITWSKDSGVNLISAENVGQNLFKFFNSYYPNLSQSKTQKIVLNLFNATTYSNFENAARDILLATKEFSVQDNV